jgi:aspartate/methionine/tyrosine aminotransferase
MSIERFELEEYFATFQSSCRFNIGSSGCKEFSLSQLLDICRVNIAELETIRFVDEDPSGSWSLRCAIAKYYGTADPNEIIVTHGSSEALYLTLTTLLQPGNKVVVAAPGYQSLLALPSYLGADLTVVPMNFSDGYRFPTERINENIDANTRLVILNSPHNPTGSVAEHSEQLAIVRRAEEVGAWVLFDEAFRDIVYGTEPSQPGRELGDQCVSIGTLSKSFGLTGLRVGWCYASKEFITDVRNLKHYTTINMSPLVDSIATYAMKSHGEIIHRLKRDATEGLSLVLDRISGSLELVPPRGGMCCFPRLPHGIDSLDFCRGLAEKNEVFLVPGAVFRNDSHIRFGFGYGKEHVEPGLDAIEDALSNA